MFMPKPAARPSRAFGGSSRKHILLLVAIVLGMAPVVLLLAAPALPAVAASAGASNPAPSAPALPAAVSDLSLSLAAAPNPVYAADPLVYTLNVSNAGPDAVATPVTLVDRLPATAAIGAASGAGWSCAAVAATLTCTLPSLAIGSASPVFVTVTAPITGGPIFSSASVTTTGSADPDLSNNSRTSETVVLAKADLSVVSGGPATVDPLGLIVYTLTVGNAGPSNFGFESFQLLNPANIAINDHAVASPYPSTIVVTGLNSVLTATATIYGFSHTWPEDVDIMLVAPGGRHTILMADPTRDNDVSGLNLTFDDTAGSTISCDRVTLVSGAYRPTNCMDIFGDDAFQAPAPTGPYSTTLSVFRGIAANGAWQLFVRDDTILDSGQVGGGWGMQLTADLGVLIVTDTLPAATTFIGASGAGWNCGVAGQVVHCVAPNFITGVAPQVVVTVSAPFAAGPLVNRALAGSIDFDPNMANNLSLLTTTVNTVRGVALSPAAPSGLAQPGAAVTYTLRLTNTGNATDAYTVTVSGNAWSTVAPAVVGPLSLGGAASVQVVVTVDAGAPLGTVDSATILVRSQGDPTRTAASVLKTTAAHIINLPLIGR